MTSWRLVHQARTLADAETVTTLLDDVDMWSRWSRPLLVQTQWDRWDNPVPGGVGAVRRLGLWPVYIRELITSYDSGRRQEYTVLSPHLFHDYLGRITLSSRSDKDTLITWGVEFTPRFAPLGRPAHHALSDVIERLASKLARAADRAWSTCPSRVDSVGPSPMLS